MYTVFTCVVVCNEPCIWFHSSTPSLIAPERPDLVHAWNDGYFAAVTAFLQYCNSVTAEIKAVIAMLQSWLSLQLWLGVGDMTKILYHDMTNSISR